LFGLLDVLLCLIMLVLNITDYSFLGVTDLLLDSDKELTKV